jgi:hypothetical protein
MNIPGLTGSHSVIPYLVPKGPPRPVVWAAASRYHCSGKFDIMGDLPSIQKQTPNPANLTTKEHSNE